MLKILVVDDEPKVRRGVSGLIRAYPDKYKLLGSCEDAGEVIQFLEDEIPDVIITDIKKSLNLYGGDVCIFYSNETNPSKSFQIASRIDRNVDNRTKTFILLLYNGTPEYDFFVGVVRQRAKDARDLTIDAKTTVDYFWDSMNEEENTQ